MTGSGSGAKATRRHRLLMVGSSASGLDETSTSVVASGGSSSVLSRAFWACTFMASAGSITTTRRRPSKRRSESRWSTRSRTWSTTISREGVRPLFGSQRPALAMTRSSLSTKTSGWVPWAILRHGPHWPQASSRGPSPPGVASQLAAWASSRAAVAFPTPSGPPSR